MVVQELGLATSDKGELIEKHGVTSSPEHLAALLGGHLLEVSDCWVVSNAAEGQLPHVAVVIELELSSFSLDRELEGVAINVLDGQWRSCQWHSAEAACQWGDTDGRAQKPLHFFSSFAKIR